MPQLGNRSGALGARSSRPASLIGKAVAGVAGIAAGTLLLSACGSGGTDVSAGQDGKKSVVLISCPDSNPWCNAFNKKLNEKLTAEGVEVTTLTNPLDMAQASQQFNQALSQHPDAILFYVPDPSAAVPLFAKAKAAGVPVVTVDSPITKEGQELVAAALQPDHAKLGEFAAVNLQEGLAAQGITKGNIIAITGSSTEITTQQRMEAFEKTLESTPGFKVVEVHDAQWDPIKTATIAQQLFAKYGNDGIQGAYGMADYMAAPIAQAADQAGIPLYPRDAKGLVVTGSNCAPTGMKAITSGLMYGGATEAPTEEATQYVPYILDVLKGETINEVVNVPVERITRENADKFKDVCNY